MLPNSHSQPPSTKKTKKHLVQNFINRVKGHKVAIGLRPFDLTNLFPQAPFPHTAGFLATFGSLGQVSKVSKLSHFKLTSIQVVYSDDLWTCHTLSCIKHTSTFLCFLLASCIITEAMVPLDHLHKPPPGRSSASFTELWSETFLSNQGW